MHREAMEVESEKKTVWTARPRGEAEAHPVRWFRRFGWADALSQDTETYSHTGGAGGGGMMTGAGVMAVGLFVGGYLMPLPVFRWGVPPPTLRA